MLPSKTAANAIPRRVRFYGAVEHVTGSCTWLRFGERQYLVDCGMIRGDEDEEAHNSDPFPFDPRALTAVYLTHAHLDHCGLIPRLYKDGFNGPVICTRATAQLAQLIMFDSAHIGGFYDARDVEKVRFIEVDGCADFQWGKPVEMGEGLWEIFRRGSHILGGSSIEFRWVDAEGRYRTIHFSGDIGNNTPDFNEQCLLKPRQRPQGATYLVCESTHGASVRDRSQIRFANRMESWRRYLTDTWIINQGTVLVPTFSIHRTPEIALDLALALARFFPEGIPSRMDLTRSKALSAITPRWTALKDFAAIRSGSVEKIGLNDAEQKVFAASFGTTLRVPGGQSSKWAQIMAEPAFVELFNDLGYARLPHDTAIFYERPAPFTIAELDGFIALLAAYGVSDCVRLGFDAAHAAGGLADDTVINVSMGTRAGQGITLGIESGTALRASRIYAREITRPYTYRYQTGTMWLNERLADEWITDAFTAEAFIWFLDGTALRFGPHNLTWDRPKDDEVHKGSHIVMSSSGMCDNGPILRHLYPVLTSPRDMLVLTGYTAEDSNSRRIQDSMTATPEELLASVIVCDYDVALPCSLIRCAIDRMDGYSGHADTAGLLDYIIERNPATGACRLPRRIFLNHGEQESSSGLRDALFARVHEMRERGVELPMPDVSIPRKGDPEFDMNENCWVE